MLGTLRLFLATLVALSHVGWHPLGINPGISAVVVFYMISGYVVTALWQRLQVQPTPVVSFYRDRLIRIYPTYFAVLAIGMLAWWWLQPQSYFLSQTPDLVDLLNNLSIVPLNFYMWNQSDQFAIIPPAWSLGTELQFYLLLPLILVRPRLFFVLSLVVACIAQYGLIPREWFTYRLLPGVLHIFLTGALLALVTPVQQRIKHAAIIWSVYATIGILLLASNNLLQHRDGALYPSGAFNVSLELLLGVLLGIPALVMLAPLRSPKWDQLAGHLSYGVFLNHFIVYWWLTRNGPEFSVGMYLSISVILGFAVWLAIERPAQLLRYRLRKMVPPNNTEG